MKFLLDTDDWKLILNSLGSILVIMGFLFLLPMVSAYYFGEPDYASAFLRAMLISFSSGVALRLFKSGRSFSFRHALAVAALTWLLVPLVSSLPFALSGLDPLDAYFESMSGWTTTGYTVIRDVESLPRSILLFRSFTQWVGGIGILLIALTVLRLPKLGHKLYAAETRSENIKFNVFDTANLIYGTYIVFTLLGVAMLFIAGMPVFDAVNHSMSAIATGGFSVKNISIEYYASNAINIAAIIVMFIGGMNIVVLYHALHGRISYLKSTETMASLGLVALSSALILAALNLDAVKIIFTAVSAITSTGYTVADISVWNDTAVFVIIILMYIGASSGSTSGAIKIWRFIIAAKDVYRETLRYIKAEHAFLPIRFGGNLVEEEDVKKVKTFVLIYIVFTVILSLMLMFYGFSMKESVFTVASAQGNIGLSVIPADRWFNMPDAAEIILIISMWVGRLEILPALVLLRSLMPSRK